MVDGYKKLHKLAFKDSDNYIDYFFCNRFKPENSFAYLDNQTVVGACHCRMLSFWMFDKSVSIPFLTGVATHPSFRHRGIASHLVNLSVKHFTKLGYPFITLHPFNAEFYQKLDFDGLNFAKTCTIDFQHRPDIYYKDITFDDLNTVLNLYQNHMNNKKCFVKRDINDFTQILTINKQDSDSAYLIYQNGIPRAYAFAEDSKIIEFVGDPDLLRSVKAFDGFVLKQETCNGDIYNMARVCDIPSLFKLLSFSADIDTCINIDGQAYHLLVKNNKLNRIEKTQDTCQFSLTNRQLILLTLGNKDKLQNIPDPLKDIFLGFQTSFFERY